MKTKYILCMMLLLFVSITSIAVPAQRVTFTHTQKDGTHLTLTFLGDEHLSYYLTSDGVAMQRGADGDFYVITDFADRKAKASARRATANAERIRRLHRNTSLVKNDLKKAFGGFNTITGSKKGLVILVNFSDVAFQKSSTKAVFDDMFNKVGYGEDGHIGSVHDYFKDQSYEQFDLTFDVVGPVTLSNNMAYYGGNNSSGNDLRPAQMAKEACSAVNSSVNFADYDWDGDGYVDQVFIIYAGYGENYGADSNTIWPHEWELYSAGVGVLSVDGVTVNTYACAAELYGISGATLNGIGTAVHEFSHCLGYPDTYDTDYSGGIGMDSYDVMCGGSYNGTRGSVPAGYTAYQRWCAGWLTPIELSSAATVTHMPALNDEGVAYIIKNKSNANEYFLLENRQSKRWFSYFNSSTAGHGLFVMHVDYNSTVWSNNEPNDDPSHQRICWVPADGSFGTYKSSDKYWSVSNAEHKGDFFPGTSNKTTLDGTSHTTVGGKWFTAESGTTTFSHTITDITETSGMISFNFDGGLHDDGSRFTITFDAGTGSCSTTSWTQTGYKQSYLLPEPTTTAKGWYGGGWSLTKITTITPLDDVGLIDYGLPYTPESDVTLYAVYINNDCDCTSCPATAVTPVIYYPHIAYLNKGADSFTPPSLTKQSDGALTYSSSNPAVATVHATTGAITLKAIGITIVTVSQAASDNYSAATASYMIKVVE